MPKKKSTTINSMNNIVSKEPLIESRALCRGPINNDNSTQRLGCGYDFTEEFAKSLPRDEPYDYECPKCGNKGIYKHVA